jgi:hypothetical protein
MFGKCSNPACGAPFNYREGRLFRFDKPPEGESSAGQDRVELFWLCGRCSELYVFEYEKGAGIKIKLRVRERPERAAPVFAIPVGR